MAAYFVQSASATAATTPVTTTLTTTPKINNLLVAAVTANVAGASISISGWTSAKTQAFVATGAIEIFYKICDGTDTTSISAVGTLATLMNIHVFEFSGFNTTTASVLDLTSSTADSGLTVTARSSGTTGTTNLADELVFVAVGTLLTNGGLVSWSNSFVTGLTTALLMTAYIIPTATGAKESTATWTTTQNAVGAVATFFASTANFYWRGGGR